MDNTNNDGNIPLSTLLAHGSKSLLKSVNYLLKAGANVNSVNASNQSPLERCCEGGFYYKNNVIDLLLSYGADINHQGYNKNTPLMWAAYNEDMETLKCLVSKGADKTLKNADGDTAYDCFYSCVESNLTANGHQEILDLLCVDSSHDNSNVNIKD